MEGQREAQEAAEIERSSWQSGKRLKKINLHPQELKMADSAQPKKDPLNKTI